MKDLEGIDYILIWKKAHNCISAEEEKKLTDWVNASEEHQLYYQKALAHYASPRKQIEPKLDSKDLIQSRLDFHKPKSSHLLKYAATIVAVLVVGAVFWMILNQENNSSRIGDTQFAELSGKSGHVILYTAGGEEIDFRKDSTYTFLDQDGQVDVAGKSLSYQDKQSIDAISKPNVLLVPRGEYFSVQLSDGSKVWLNSETILKYPSVFSGDLREVEFTGEAYFEIAKDPNRPFVIHTQDQKIEVLGTAFNVTSYSDEEKIVTTLVEGKVELEMTSGEKVILEPNEQSVLYKSNGIISKSTVNVESYVSWRHGVMYFEQLELEELLSRVSRWYDLEIRFENQEMKSKKFTGEIARYEEVTQFLEMLETSGIVEFNLEKNVITVK